MHKVQWSRSRPDAPDAPDGPTRHNAPARREGHELARAQADMLEAKRRIERQTILIGEFAARGEPTLEPAKALARLETKMLETHDRHQQLLGRLSSV